jgi:UDP-N-acetylmuramoyl-tripeptide--D-alanyl-D-alanine ligase
VSFARVALDIVVAAAALAAYVIALMRWLRVLQREHYEPGSVRRFWNRWASVRSETTGPAWLSSPSALAAVALVLVIVLFAVRLDAAAVAVAALYGALFPLGLSVRGRTSALAWTRRLTTVAVVVVVESLILLTPALFAPRPWAGAVLVLALEPYLVDLAAWLTRPYENRRAMVFVRQAQERLAKVHPVIVGITGSFGKTSTKHHLAELLGGRHGVLPTPRSYNNRAGLSRAINENLTEGTRIFIAEMGIYGPGELAEMCSWCTPSIAIVTAIGPVHLERMGSLDVIESAKHEITDRAETVILNVDDARLARWVEPLRAAGKKVRTAGSVTADADVRVAMVAERWHLSVDGVGVGIAPPVSGVRESNLACAIAAALELGVHVDEVIGRLTHLTSVPNRMVVATAPSGVMVIDDTFSANPSGSANSLATLSALPVNGRRVVVTPGMVELGTIQATANERLGHDIRDLGAELVIVGRINAAALCAGYGTPVARFRTREQAVEWVRRELHSGDGVLYLNDLPDHYP